MTIGMPVFNGERYLESAVISILDQTYRDFQLVISDNGSTDQTREICEAYAASEPRIRYFRHEKNLGAAHNYNRVFDLSRGRYFKWAAHDDLCGPEFLERCVEVLESNSSVVLCYPRTHLIDERGLFIDVYDDDLDLKSQRAHERFRQFHERYRHPAKCNPIFGLIRASALQDTQRIGRFISSDMILLGELSLLGQFVEIPARLFSRRDHRYRSVRALPGHAARALWFDPTHRRVEKYVRFRWCKEYFRIIERAPISRVEKAHCYLQMGKWLAWNRKPLTRELIRAARIFSRQLPTPIWRLLRFSWKSVSKVARMVQVGRSNLS